MRIHSIEIEGWMPFTGAFKLDLPSGPIAVVGSHGGDERRSNRAGKTSLLEAITWCLYGVHRKRLDDSIINNSVDQCSVVVCFGDTTVRRSRARGHSTKLVVATPTAEFVGEAAQVELDNSIGLGLDDYLATSCFRQGDVESIISRTPGERLALVSEWLQQSRWTDARKIQATKANVTDTRLGEKRAALDNAGRYLLTPESRVEIEEQLVALRERLGPMDARMKELSSRMADAMEAKQQLDKHAELKALRSTTADLRKKLEGRKEVDMALGEAVKAETEAASAAATTKAAVADLVRVRTSGFDGVCPVTCSQCPVADSVTETTRARDELLRERRAADANKQHALGFATAASETARRHARGFEQLAAQYQQNVTRGKQLAAALTLTEEQAAAVPSAAPLQGELDALRGEYSELSRKVGELQHQLSTGAANERRYQDLTVDVGAAEEASKVSRLALRAISSVPARIAAQQLGELEQEANVLLQGSGVSLRFSWARELADKAQSCEECGYVYPTKRGDTCPTCQAARGKKRSQELELLCDDGSGVEEDVRFNSGGTRAIVGASIRLAASAMLRRLRSSRATWAIVDEPFGSLDAENREQLARTFAGMLAGVGLEQALVVSHDPLLLAALPSRIVIDKDGTSSTARIE